LRKPYTGCPLKTGITEVIFDVSDVSIDHRIVRLSMDQLVLEAIDAHKNGEVYEVAEGEVQVQVCFKIVCLGKRRT
jgi:regulator of RNase E activity RraB